MKKIYCISGLGADHRLFCNLHISGFELVAVPWVPFDVKDDMQSYALKMAATIKEEHPILIGLSFGGMLAVEISKVLANFRVFLISSAKNPAEMSIPGGWLSKKVVQSGVVPLQLFNTPNFLVLDYLGAKTNEEKELLRQIIKDSDSKFMRWAINAIINWKTNSTDPKVIHIHGTADRIIPSANVHPDYWIEGGSHIIVYNRAEEIARIIEGVLCQ